MSFRFEGREFATMADFARAYPAYRTHAQAVRDGASTIVDLERHIVQMSARAKQAAMAIAPAATPHRPVRAAQQPPETIEQFLARGGQVERLPGFERIKPAALMPMGRFAA